MNHGSTADAQWMLDVSEDHHSMEEHPHDDMFELSGSSMSHDCLMDLFMTADSVGGGNDRSNANTTGHHPKLGVGAPPTITAPHAFVVKTELESTEESSTHDHDFPGAVRGAGVSTALAGQHQEHRAKQRNVEKKKKKKNTTKTTTIRKQHPRMPSGGSRARKSSRRSSSADTQSTSEDGVDGVAGAAPVVAVVNAGAPAGVVVAHTTEEANSMESGKITTHRSEYSKRCRRKLNDKLSLLLLKLPAPPENRKIRHKHEIVEYAIEVLDSLRASGALQ